MKRIMGILLFSLFCCVGDGLAQTMEVNQELLNYYKEEGRKEAEQMVKEYYAMQKPQFQETYDDYLNDLKAIAKTGRAPDNEALYHDLKKMSYEEEFVYSDSEETYYQ